MSPLLHERERLGCRVEGPRALGRYSAAAGVFNNIAPSPARRKGLIALIAAIILMLSAGISGAAAQGAPRVLAFGDSLTAGYGLPADDAFPVQLQARLAAAGIAAKVVNGGISGDTSAGGLARLDWALADHPDVVLLELGANDALRGIDPKLTYGNLDKILARVKESGAKVLLLGMLAPPNWGRDYQKEFDAIYPTLAQKYKVPLYPFFLDGVATVNGLNQEDGLHPNAAGVELIANRVAPYVLRLLGQRGVQG